MKMKLTRLVYPNYDKSAPAEFVAKYPKIKELVKCSKGRNIVGRYNSFLKLKDEQQAIIGGTPKTLTSPSFGTKTFYEYQWPKDNNYKRQIGFAEVFTYCIEELHL